MREDKTSSTIAKEKLDSLKNLKRGAIYRRTKGYTDNTIVTTQKYAYLLATTGIKPAGLVERQISASYQSHAKATAAAGTSGKVKSVLRVDLTTGEQVYMAGKICFVETKDDTSPTKRKPVPDALIMQEHRLFTNVKGHQNIQLFKYKNRRNKCKALLVMPDYGLDLIVYLNTRFDIGQDFSLKEKVELALGCARALSETHQKGIIHIDVKLGNFCIDKQGQITLVDYGFAQETKAGHDFAEKTNSCGSLTFVAPEIIEQIHSADSEGGNNTVYKYYKKSDLFSLGLCIAPIFGFKHVLSTKSEQARINQIVNHSNDSKYDHVLSGDNNILTFNETFFPSSELDRLQVPQPILDILLSILQKKPSDRMSLDQVIEKLETFAASQAKASSSSANDSNHASASSSAYQALPQQEVAEKKLSDSKTRSGKKAGLFSKRAKPVRQALATTPLTRRADSCSF